jgi:hypothetical protein
MTTSSRVESSNATRRGIGVRYFGRNKDLPLKAENGSFSHEKIYRQTMKHVKEKAEVGSNLLVTHIPGEKGA